MDSPRAAGGDDCLLLRQAISVLLECIAENSPTSQICDPDFLDLIRSIKAGIDQAEETANVLHGVNEAVQAMEAHTAAFNHRIANHRRELDAVQSQMQHLAELFGPPDDKVAFPQSIARSDYESGAEEAEAASSSRARATLPARARSSDIDPITGLPNAERARQAIANAIASSDNMYAALFMVERVDIVNSRFGFAVGDRMLVMFSQYVSEQLAARDHLFRWRGPTFVALMERDQPERVVDGEVLRTASARLEYIVNTRDHDVLLRVSCAHSVLKLAGLSLDAIVEAIDAFSANPATVTR